MTISGIKNPFSTTPTHNFAINTYYESTDDTLVATGTISGITAVAATIDYTKIAISSSSLVTSATLVTYSFSFII